MAPHPQEAGSMGASPPIRPLPPNPLGVAVLATSSVGIFIDLIAIGLRLWSRKIKRKRLNAGDYVIIAAWLLAFADTLRKIWAYKWGVGLHIWDVTATDPTHLMDAGAITFAGYPIWLACVTLIKVAILIAFTDFFFCLVWFMRCVYATMVLCGLFFVGFMAGVMTQCSPIEYNWNPYIEGHCNMDRKNGFYLVGGCNLFLDIIIVLLPMPVVWTLNISRLKKVGVSAMFGLGFVIVVLVGLRFHLMKKQNQDDFLHDGEIAGIYNSMEIYLGIISSCLPFISPSIGRIGTNVSQSRVGLYLQTFTSRSTSQKSHDGRSSEADSIELVDGSKKSSITTAISKKKKSKDPFSISVIDRDEEMNVYGRGDDFVTVPDHWPSEGQPRMDWETVHANELSSK